MFRTKLFEHVVGTLSFDARKRIPPDDLFLRRSDPTTMIRFLAFRLVVSGLVLAANAAADRVYRNGRVFTADAHGSIAEAVAIREGRIVHVGSCNGGNPLVRDLPDRK